MAHVATNWTDHIAQLGNRPGKHAGDVTVYLVQPVEGSRAWTVPSDTVTVAAEQGCLVGIQLTLADGRRAFAPGSNVLAIVDASREAAE